MTKTRGNDENLFVDIGFNGPQTSTNSLRMHQPSFVLAVADYPGLNGRPLDRLSLRSPAILFASD
jgi:hypothetical protein